MRHWRNDLVLNAAEKNIKYQTNEIKLELKIRNKAIENKSFPSETVIAEFLTVPQYPEVTAKWVLPDINSFIVSRYRKMYLLFSMILYYKLSRKIINKFKFGIVGVYRRENSVKRSLMH